MGGKWAALVLIVFICMAIVCIVGVAGVNDVDNVRENKVIDVRILEMSPGVQEQFRQLEERIKMLEDMLEGFMRSQGGQ